MKAISYVNSILNMEVPLTRARALAVKKNKAKRGELVTPSLYIKVNPNLEFMSKAITQIKLSLRAKKLGVLDGKSVITKYSARIT